MANLYAAITLLGLSSSLLCTSSALAQNIVASQDRAPIHLIANGKIRDYEIKVSDENSFVVELEKNRKYVIDVEQEGIDVAVRLSDESGKLIKEQDSPNGNDGPERIFIQPEKTGQFFILVKPLRKPRNPPSGHYSIRVDQAAGDTPRFPLEALQEDFDLLVSSLKEAHTGLNWYSTYREFDDFCANQRKLLHDKMDVLDFYRVVAPIIAFTKEGHTAIRLSAENTAYFQAFGRYFPLQIKLLNKHAYVINDFDGLKTKGMELMMINGKDIAEIVDTFLKVEPDDGFIVTGKYRWIEENGAFPWYYFRCFGGAERYAVELVDPKTGQKTVMDKIRGVRYAEYRRIWKESAAPSETDFPAAKIDFQPELKTAILTFNTFDTVFKGEKFDFKAFTDKAFEEIGRRDVDHLIIDVRKNDGGEEGLEDYVYAFLSNKPYTKYRYVQASGPSYSFLKYTNYNTKEKQARFETAMKSEHYLSSDGRFLRKKEILVPAAPRENAYAGKIYVLTGGLTYSGGSEFASIIKGNRPQSIFIGEETGGGYYGNTSGSYLILTLPNSKLTIRIPLLKFVVEVGGDIPFGRGVIPDHEVQPSIDQYLNGTDAEMNFTLKLIRERR
jgi:C-terminal processing protease CtpA/Prc